MDQKHKKVIDLNSYFGEFAHFTYTNNHNSKKKIYNVNLLALKTIIYYR